MEELNGDFVCSSIAGMSFFLPRLSSRGEHIVLQPRVNQHDVDLHQFDVIADGKQPMKEPIYKASIENNVCYKMTDPMMVMMV